PAPRRLGDLLVGRRGTGKFWRSKASGCQSEGFQTAMSYAGDLRPSEAWDMLARDADATLVDVRSRPEWTFVGVPDLTALGKKPILLSWQDFPTMAVDPDF